ncbi:MAG TPA: HD domain-containing phosphohydrolase [Candidatus Ozemobacteraceae bacterium]
MKPLELNSISEVWKTVLTDLKTALAATGSNLQIWFPWGRTWRGQDSRGSLPPTELPAELAAIPAGMHFAGRWWRPITAAGMTWLISFTTAGDTEKSLSSWQPGPQIVSALTLLGEFVRLESLLGLFLKVLENRASEEYGHWDRVRNYCVAIGRNMGLSHRELIDLELAGLLHDIGKVSISPALLEERRPLSSAERRQVESHAVVGAAMIREIPGLDRVADAVLSHHENPDGSGYPRGLRDPEIPLAGLIVSVADSFDAMTHYRPYAAERTYRESIDEMGRQQGRYDERVLWALQQVLKQLGILEVRPITAPAPVGR